DDAGAEVDTDGVVVVFLPDFYRSIVVRVVAPASCRTYGARADLMACAPSPCGLGYLVPRLRRLSFWRFRCPIAVCTKSAGLKGRRYKFHDRFTACGVFSRLRASFWSRGALGVWVFGFCGRLCRLG